LGAHIAGAYIYSNNVVQSQGTTTLYAATASYKSGIDINGDLTQRAEDRHYFGTDYMGSDGTNFFLNHLGTNYYIQVSTNAPVY